MKLLRKYRYKKEDMEHKIKYFCGIPYAETQITKIDGKNFNKDCP
ncbi:MAG: hypothetical protein ACI4OR_03005 [Alphaproteobacteria bacterium]